MLNFVRETGLDFSLFVYGVGDHGGGPTRRDLLMGRELNQWPIFPKVELAPIGRFFSRLDTEAVDLPLLDCELNYEFTGCYTTQTVIKKANRFGEKNLADAEIAAAFASRILGNSYPRDKFVTGWRDILFSHFHDILPGSGVHDTRTYTHGLYQETMAETSMIETQALRGIAARIDTRGFAGDADAPWATLRLPTAMGSGVGFRSSDGRVSEAEQSSGSGTRPHVVFNPTAADRREIVTATLWDNAWGWRRHELPRVPFHVTGPDGTKVPAQTVDVGSYWGHDYVRVAFPVEVPAFGFATYAVSEGAVPAVESQVRQLVSDHHCAYARRERQLDGIENEYLRLELDMQGGGIRRLTDVVNGVDLISPDNPSPVLEYGVERPHPMTAWLVDHTGATEAPEVKAIERRSKGPWTVSLEVRCRIGNSEFTVVYELRADDPCLYLHINGTWYERGTPQTGVPVLRLSLPFAMEDVKGSYEIPFGAVDRDCVADEEVPALQWACFRGRTPKGSAGVLLLNDTKHGHALEGSTARVTLIRSSYDPDPLPEVGQHEMHFALRVVDEASDVHAAIAAGNSFNHALRVIGTDLHEGGLPTVAGLVSVPTPGVSVSTLKIAEDGNGLIVRLYESDGAARVAEVKLDSALLGAVRAVTEVDLMERPLDTCTAELVDDATVRVQIPARGIASLLLRLAD
jgi:alpha-mannosidase